MGIKFQYEARLDVIDYVPISAETGGVAIVDQDTIVLSFNNDNAYSLYDHKNKVLNTSDTLTLDHPSYIRTILLKTDKPVDITLNYAGGSALLTIEKVFQIVGEFTSINITGKEDTTYIRAVVLGSD